MGNRLLNQYRAVLFDMHGTFMFGHDRFGESENFHHTYLSLGGNVLSATGVTQHIRACIKGLDNEALDPRSHENFPTLTEAFQKYTSPPKSELTLLSHVFAQHEAGRVSSADASFLQRLAATHRLAVISNIWSPKQLWLDEFKRAGIDQVFRCQVFSSDRREIKPSSALFLEALRGLEVRPKESLFVGDSLRCDMEGAHKVGIATAWITEETQCPPSVNYLLRSIQEIEQLTC